MVSGMMSAGTTVQQSAGNQSRQTKPHGTTKEGVPRRAVSNTSHRARNHTYLLSSTSETGQGIGLVFSPVLRLVLLFHFKNKLLTK